MAACRAWQQSRAKDHLSELRVPRRRWPLGRKQQPLQLLQTLAQALLVPQV
jgi:hypothetical protein